MKAHIFNDGGGMVTGTTDIEAARELLKSTWIHERGTGVDVELRDREDWERAELAVFDGEGKVETGRVVPAGPYDDDGNTWYWRAGYKPGVRGVTTAVVFREDPLRKMVTAAELARALGQVTS